MDVDRATAYFNPGGGLARHLGAFEHRPQQAVMAGAVTRALIEGHPLMVEAGTGTGKSLAYLLPALLWAVQNNKRVIVSTYTKTLQEQILHQDIPLLQKVLPVPFRYALCLGHENYLSL
ncbi:MAG: DEAD/DEAH box helicase, partial [Nitrospinaceae bacterium]